MEQNTKKGTYTGNTWLVFKPQNTYLSHRDGVECVGNVLPYRKHQQSWLAVRLVYQTGCEYLVNIFSSHISLLMLTNLLSSSAGNPKSELGDTWTQSTILLSAECAVSCTLLPSVSLPRHGVK
jgi:hypothetical protein